MGHSRVAGCVATQVIVSVYNEQCVCVLSLWAQRSFQREPMRCLGHSRSEPIAEVPSFHLEFHSSVEPNSCPGF